MPAAPEKIGPYVITGKIGSGGMATVYRALHPDDGREVALKVLAIYLAEDKDMRRRFEREAHTLLQFKHPHILPVYDVGEENGTPYLVMKLLGGRSLADLLRSGKPLPNAEVGRYTRQIASALDYAHARGIIHRDVKPANILLDEAGTSFLADFGVAYLTAAGSAARLTQEGAFVGTAAYASPEQCQGGKLDRPSDIYSLAVMVFQMTTGRLPFESSSPLAVIKMHLRDAPPNPLAFNPFLPVALYNVLVKALAKLPEARHPSAMKFSEAVDQAFGLHVLPEADSEDGWLHDDIIPVLPDGPAGWTTVPDETPARVDPFEFDADMEYSGPADPFVDAEIEEVVVRFSGQAFDDYFDPHFDNSAADGAAFAVDFSDEAGLEDDFPSSSLVLKTTTAVQPSHSTVVRPLRPAAALPHVTRRRTPALLYGAIVLVLIAFAAAGAIIYAARDGSPAETTATLRSEMLGVTFEHPAGWYAVPAQVAVLSSTPASSVLLSDQPVAGGIYAGASIVIAVQPIDPVEVFGVPPGCTNRVFEGPPQTFACMEGRGFATPVYTLFSTPVYESGVRLPGTIPPARASLPAILFPTGRANWMALVIVHWDGYDGAQNALARIARSVRPNEAE